MNLFKRLIISLFPKDITNNSVNPANMFVSFISTKDFFSIINRKIVENYKTNLFDISLEPLDAQIGFDNKTKLNKQEINDYYAYCSVANINGYTFYNISNISCCMTLASAVLLKDIFKKYDEKIFTSFLFTIYLLPYIFSTGLKKFPSNERKKNYNWLVELTFEFFNTTIKKQQKNNIGTIKQEILSHPSIFFVILDLLQNFQNLLLRNPEYSESKQDTTILSWITQGTKFRTKPYETNLNSEELHLLTKIFPNDILPKYLFNEMNSFLIVDTIIESIYDKKTLQDYSQKIKEQKVPIQEFISYITNISTFKKNFFNGGKKYIAHFHRTEYDGDIAYDIEDIISEIGENPDGIEKFQIPESIKQESKIMEKILNFYITLLAGFSTAKADSFYLRLYQPMILNEITTTLKGKNKAIKENKIDNHDSYFLRNYYELYHTCDQYYENVYDGIKKNKKKIIFQYYSTENQKIPEGTKKIIQENFIANLLQEINPRNTKLYIKNPVLLETFRQHFSEDINIMIQGKGEALIENIFHDITILLDDKNILTRPLIKYLTEKDIFNLKENLYTVDFWIRRKILQKLKHSPILMLGNTTILGIVSLMRETLLGLGILFQYFKTNHYEHFLIPLMEVYIYRILGIEEPLQSILRKSLVETFEEHEDILQLRIHLDDNKEFLGIITKQFKKFKRKNTEEKIILTNENILWIKGLLQNINSYNKRYLIPSTR